MRSPVGALVAEAGAEASEPRRFDPALMLVFGGIALVFLALLSAAFWEPGYAIYLLGGGILVLAAGFYFASKSE